MNGNEERLLPVGWAWIGLEDCAEILDRYRIPINSSERAQRTEGIPENKLIPYYGATGQVGWIDDYIFDEELVLLGEDGAPFLDGGKDIAYIIRGKSWVNNHAHVLRALDPLTNNQYLLHYLNTFDYHEYLTGTTRLKLNQSRMKEIPVPIAPPNQQHRIVAEIEKQFTRLDQAVGSLRRVQEKLARYKASVLKAACEGRLVAQDKKDEPASELLIRILAERRAQWEAANPGEKYQEPTGVDTAELPRLPEGWVWTNLAQIKIFSLYGPRFSSNDYAKSGRLVLRTSDISESGKVDYAKTPRLPLSDSDFAKYKCNIGDLLITRTGSLGTLAVFNDHVDAIPGAYLIQYRIAAPLIVSWYIYYFLKSPIGQKHLLEGGAGVGRSNLNGPTVDSITIPFPPLAEQKRIVAEAEQRLSIVSATEQAITANLARAERLRQSILHRAFTGQLVPQNPDDEDEPASSLLERIQIERKRRDQEEKANKKITPSRGRKPMMTKKKRQNLYETLLENSPLSGDELFSLAGFEVDQVEMFYEELRAQVSKNRIAIERLNEIDVVLKIVGG